MTTQTNLNERIHLAASWYEHGEPTWETGYATISIVDRIDWDLLTGIWESIIAEREEHNTRATAYATAQTGYTFDIMTIGSDAYLAHEVIRQTEYTRLEAAAKERRILALADCIR